MVETIAFPQPEAEQFNDILAKLRNPEFVPSYEALHEAMYRHDDNDTWVELMWNRERPIFEVLTQEYIEIMANYIVDRARTMATEDTAVTVLEIGAGNGRLTHLLRNAVNALIPDNSPQIHFVATDSGEWEIQADYTVEPLDHKTALEKYKPNIVISSWMPSAVDWTEDIRAIPEVEEYILIGPPDEITVGHPWLTWGQNHLEIDLTNPSRLANILNSIKSWLGRKQVLPEKSPPYETDGFTRTNMNNLRNKQICRLDKFRSIDSRSESSTVSFQRRKV